MTALKRLLAVMLVFATLGAATYAWIGPPESWWRLERVEREGPPLLVEHGGRAHFWELAKLDERQWIFGNQIAKRHHFELRVHDVATAELAWRRRLLSLDADRLGYTPRARLLGQDGEVVWLFLHDQSVAATVADGMLIAGRQQLEARSRDLAGVMPTDLGSYAHDEGLVILTTDVRRWRVRAAGLQAEPYVPRSEEHLSRIRYIATQWDGSFELSELLVRSFTAEGRWIGLLSQAEMAEAMTDRFDTTLKFPDMILNQGSMAERTLWAARTSPNPTRLGERLADVAPLASNRYAFVGGGFLVSTTGRHPKRLEDGGLLVVHNVPFRLQRRPALTRIGSDFTMRWTAVLPIDVVANRWDLPGITLLFGTVISTEPDEPPVQEIIVSVDLSSGATRAWNLTLDRRS